MNKKLKKGLTTTMAAAMGLGVVIPAVPVIAAPATSGWVKTAAGWTYLKSGVNATGWVKDGGAWYFLDSNGVMKTGWVKDAGTWYYLNASGAMATGWFKDADGSWYFLKTSGAMAASTWVGNYYLGASGAMLTSTVTPDGYTVDANGAWDGKPANTTPVVTDLKVSSVSVNAANSVKVVFNQAPADTSKVAFTVNNGSVPMTVTATWNAAKTEVVLTNSANLPAGTYSVNVKNDTTDLGTSSVTVTSQKVAKINITSAKLGVTTSGATQIGYATYTVLDQYGVDITNSSLANNVTFQSGAGTPTWKNGVIKLTASSSLNLLSLSSVVITGYDSSTGVTTTATLATTTQVGTLSDIQVGTALTNADSKVLTAGDTTDVFYLPYTAYDISGNPTSNFDLVKAGLILTSGNQLTTSANSYVTATLEQDPNDSTKAVIKVVATGSTVSMDMPVVITAMTWTGKTSSINVTLKKAAALDSFALSAPAYDIATGENKEIPFTALDQNGAALTKYDDIVNDVTLNNAYLVKNVDGTASLKVGPNTGVGFANDGQQIVTAMTKTGKYSSITLNIQKAAKADTLSIDSSVLVNAMEKNATQSIDFGYSYGGFTVKDQYGRVMDMTGAPGNYEIITDATGVTATGAAAGATPITISAGSTAGTGTVTFKLVDSTAPTVVIDSKTVTFSVLDVTDIKGYTMDTITDPIYATNAANATAVATKRDASYEANPYVYGTTSSGSKVILAGTPIIGAYVDNSDFVIDGTPDTYDSLEVSANKFTDLTKTGSTATLTVLLKDVDGSLNSVKTTIKSTTAAPVASTMAFYADTTIPGISVSGDTVTVDITNNSGVLAAAGFANGKSLARFDVNGDNANRAKVYLYAKDQYGTKAIKLANFSIANSSANLAGYIDGNGSIISANTPVAGDYITITGITSNGLMKTFKIVFK